MYLCFTAVGAVVVDEGLRCGDRCAVRKREGALDPPGVLRLNGRAKDGGYQQGQAAVPEFSVLVSAFHDGVPDGCP